MAAFDDVPVGGGTGKTMSEFPEGDELMNFVEPPKAKKMPAHLMKKMKAKEAAAAAPPSSPGLGTPAETAAEAPVEPDSTPTEEAVADAAPPTPPEFCTTPEAAHTSTEDCVAQAPQLLPAEILEGLANEASHADRSKAIVAIRALIPDMSNSCDAATMGRNAEIIVRYLSTCPGYKEKVLFVWREMVLTFTACAGVPAFNRSGAACAISGICKKFGEKKIEKEVEESLYALAEAVSPPFVFRQVIEQMALPDAKAKDQKITTPPKTLLVAVTWIDAAIRSFTCPGSSFKDVVEFAKVLLGSKDAAVRQGATNLLVSCSLYLRGVLDTMIDDIQPETLKKNVVKAIADAKDVPTPSPTRWYRRDESLKPQAAGAKGKKAACEDLLEAMIPRVDICGKAKAKAVDAICKQLASTKVPEIQEGLKGIEGLVVEAKNRILPTIDPFLNGLKQALKHSSKAANQNALRLIEVLVKALGDSVGKYTKNLLPSVMQTLGNSDARQRQMSQGVLKCWAEQTSAAPLVPLMLSLLADLNPVAKSEAALWFKTNVALLNVPFDRISLAAPAVQALQDSKADIRGTGEILLQEAMSTEGGAKAVLQAINGLPKASQLTVRPFFDKYKEGVAAPSGFGGAGAPKAAVSEASSDAPTVEEDEAPATPSRAVPAGDAPPSAKKGAKKGGKPAAAKAAPPAPAKRAAAKKAPEKKEAEAPVDDSAVLIPGRHKEARAKKNRGIKWQIGDHDQSRQIDALKEEAIAGFGRNFADDAFSTDFKKQAKAVEALSAELAAGVGTTQDCLDLIFKWVTVRIGEGNTTVVMKILAYLEAVFAALKTAEYQLTEYETGVLLPNLFDRLGQSKETMRDNMKSLLPALEHIVPAPKIFQNAIAALVSRNAKSRADMCCEMTRLIGEHGVSVLNPARDLKPMSAAAGDADSKVRDAALTMMAECFKLLGNAFWTPIEGIARPVKEAIQGRIKALGIQAPEASTEAATRAPASTELRSSASAHAGAPSTPRAAAPDTPVAAPAPLDDDSVMHPPALSSSLRGAPVAVAAKPADKPVARETRIGQPSRIGGVSRIGGGLRQVPAPTSTAETPQTSVPAPSTPSRAAPSTPGRTAGRKEFDLSVFVERITSDSHVVVHSASQALEKAFGSLVPDLQRAHVSATDYKTMVNTVLQQLMGRFKVTHGAALFAGCRHLVHSLFQLMTMSEHYAHFTRNEMFSVVWGLIKCENFLRDHADVENHKEMAAQLTTIHYDIINKGPRALVYGALFQCLSQLQFSLDAADAAGKSLMSLASKRPIEEAQFLLKEAAEFHVRPFEAGCSDAVKSSIERTVQTVVDRIVGEYGADAKTMLDDLAAAGLSETALRQMKALLDQSLRTPKPFVSAPFSPAVVLSTPVRQPLPPPISRTPLGLSGTVNGASGFAQSLSKREGSTLAASLRSPMSPVVAASPRAPVAKFVDTASENEKSTAATTADSSTVESPSKAKNPYSASEIEKRVSMYITNLRKVQRQFDLPLTTLVPTDAAA